MFVHCHFFLQRLLSIRIAYALAVTYTQVIIITGRSIAFCPTTYTQHKQNNSKSNAPIPTRARVIASVGLVDVRFGFAGLDVA